jgi:UDP-glucuronate 4-epimerase
MQEMRVLVTGAAGFIGFHVARAFLQRGDVVAGVDVVNSYYDPKLKHSRLELLRGFEGFRDFRTDISDADALIDVFAQVKPDRVIHLAAQAGVRYSIDNPSAYVLSNLVGFANILEGSRRAEVQHLVYASTSSVYGANASFPFRESDGAGHPMSFYAATKRSNELMAHSYAHLFGLPCTGLRFFTVYGPWGRPDMALFKFTKNILEGNPIEVFNNGDMRRDFTYVDDIVEGIVRLSDVPATTDTLWDAGLAVPPPNSSGVAPFRLYNIGNGAPVQLMEFISSIEEKLQKTAKITYLPMQAGDVSNTYADTSALAQAVSFRPATPIRVGIDNFVDWYRSYYDV